VDKAVNQQGRESLSVLEKLHVLGVGALWCGLGL